LKIICGSVVIMPEWVKDALIKRFDERSIQSEKIRDMEILKEQLLAMEGGIISKITEDDQQLVHDWLDLYVRMTAIQNEWLFMKGIQDGMQLLMYLELDGDV
jgi:hypothetical protein